jgi:undecaprenyl-diphosphatase
MEIWKAIIVGVVQGLAEFLPVSSSGHIVLTQYLLGIRVEGALHQPDLSFEIILHLGTLVSVLLFFRKSLWKLVQSLYTKDMAEERMKILYLGLATVPAVIAALLFKDLFDAAPGNPVLVSGLLVVTGLVLFVPRLVKGGQGAVGFKGALMMGIGQAFAILPGISRSGSTIAAGLVSGVKAEKAAEFSFLMSIPAIAGGFVLTMKKKVDGIELQTLDQYKESGTVDPSVAHIVSDKLEIDKVEVLSRALTECFNPAFLAGAIAAGVVGLLAIYLVMGAVKRGKLEYFSYYCFAAGISGMLYFSLT